MINLTQGNIIEWAATYDGPKFHALLCDPPYHLTSGNLAVDWSAFQTEKGQTNQKGRASRGFMGQTWDGGDIAFQPDTWAALAQHLHPGAFGMAFAGSRGWHRMAVAIEDAGLIIHPTIFNWAYGSGFPKATNPADQYVAQKLRAWLADHPDEALALKSAQQAVRDSKHGATAAPRKAYQRIKQQLLEAAGLTREVGRKKHAPKFAAADFDYLDPVAAALAGHRYGLQAMKPAVEPIIVFQKPYSGRAIDDIVATGAGALWIDGSRIGDELIPGGNGRLGTYGIYHGMARDPSTSTVNSGRWPANLAISHHPACTDAACHPDCNVLHLAEQSGERPSSQPAGDYGSLHDGRENSVYGKGLYSSRPCRAPIGDSGTAARYFYNADWMYERLELVDQVGYFAKASKAEREAGLDPAQIALMQLIDAEFEAFDPETVDDGRETSIDNPYQRGETERRNTHPTIKPLSLNRWLATLLLPPDLGQERRLLVPFGGVASEVIGGMLAGWKHVQGIELGEEHVRIGRARIAYWQQRKGEFDQGQSIKVRGAEKHNQGQSSFFDEV